MSPRRRRRPDGAYPDLSARDVVRDGQVLMLRNHAGRKFSKRSSMRITASWTDLEDLPAAFERARLDEQTQTANIPPAWDPEFGYLSPDPCCCGCGTYLSCMMHLEALNLLGDIKRVLAALDAVRIDAWGFQTEGMHDTAHLYRMENKSSIGISAEDLLRRVSAVYKGVVTQELNARRHLVEEAQRVFADAIARSLAVLRFGRLISPWELTDILSPIRMAASMGFMDGITKEEIDDFTMNQLKKPYDSVDLHDDARARDRRDARFADRLNVRFARVGLNAYGKELLEQ